MVASAFTVANIKPSLNVDSAQRFIFGVPETPEPLGALKLDNIYIPVLNSPSILNLESRNNTLSGFRWKHITTNTDTTGSLTLQSFVNASPTGTDLFTFNQDSTVTFHVPTNISGGGITLTGAVTGSGTSTINTTLTPITTSQITDFTTSVNNLINTGFGPNVSLPFANLNYNWVSPSSSAYSISNNLNDNNIQKSLVWDIVADNATSTKKRYWRQLFNIIESTGTGGSYGNYSLIFSPSTESGLSPITPMLISINTATGNKITFGMNIDIDSHKITSSAAPTVSNDLTNKGYVDTAIDNKTITLTGAVTGSGNSTINTTLTPITTSQITDFTTAVNNLVDTSFGPNVDLPFTQVNYNWSNTGSQSSYNETVNLNDSYSQKAYFYDIAADSVDTDKKRFWREIYSINESIPPLGDYASYGLYFFPSAESSLLNFHIQTIDVNSLTGAKVSFLVPVSCGKLTVQNNPLSILDATNKGYVDTAIANKTITLTGAVTGSGTSIINTTLTPITTSQITDFTTAVNNLVDTSFGPNVDLPFTELRYNWTQNSAQIFHDLQSSVGGSKIFFNQVGVDRDLTSKLRYWQESYIVNSSIQPANGGEYGSYILNFVPSAESGASPIEAYAVVLNTPEHIIRLGINNFVPTDRVKYNWENITAQVIQNLDNSFATKTFTHDIVADINTSVKNRFWRELYTIRESVPSSEYGSYSLSFVPSVESGGPTINVYSISLNSTTGPVFSLEVPLNTNNLRITGLPTPVSLNEATNKEYVDTAIDNKTITLTGAVTGSGTSIINTTLTPITTSQITDFTTAVNNLVDTGFGPTVALPFANLSYNWVSPGSGAYTISNNLNDNNALKSLVWDIVADNADSNKRRYWRQLCNLINSTGTGGSYGSYSLQFSPSIESGLSNITAILVNINTTVGNSITFGMNINASNFRITSLATPTLGTDGTNKNYVDNKTWTTSQIIDFTSSVAIAVAAATITPSQISGFPNNTTTFLRGDGTWANSLTGNLGIGTTTTTQARLTLNGGVQNIAGEDTAFRAISSANSVKIELQNTAASGKLYEMSSTSTGSFILTDRTASTQRIVVNSLGIGIAGCTSPNGGLHLGNVVANRRIVLFDVAGNDNQFDGFGINNNIFRYQSDATTVDHVWYAAASTTVSNELWRVKGTGDAILPSGTLYARRCSGSINMQGNATGTTVATANTFVKVAGVTSSTNLNQFTAASNRLTYTGTNSILALVISNFTATYNTGTTDDIIFAIYKNGAQIPESRISYNLSSLFGSIPDLPFSINTTTTLNPNDYVELWVTMTTGGRTVTVSRFMMTASAI